MATAIGRLHLITDSRPGRNTLGVVTAAMRAAREAVDLGVGPLCVQVRVEDEMTDRDAYELSGRVAALCRDAGAVCLVNDRLHIALAVGANGGHVGAEDLPVAAARGVLGPYAVVGATAREPDTAKRHVADGATYLGVGPAYASPTKTSLPAPIGPVGVAAVAGAVRVPVIAIGGVTPDRVAELTDAGAHGVAVIGAINSAPDPHTATLEFFRALAAHSSGDQGAVDATRRGDTQQSLDHRYDLGERS
ncbi:MAG: thiamine phosphate synthase [Micromonosporaceae bacterium]|nr:thiamine phosphate synthase [Micromonosporaceae bacterium]